MSVTSVIGRRVATYTSNNETKQILQLASVTSITDKAVRAKSLTHYSRGFINDLRSIVGLTASDTTNFIYPETATFIDVQPTWTPTILMRGFMVFKTPRGYQTINFRDFEIMTSSSSWGVADEINRQMNLYADGNLPSGTYVEDYNCRNWVWVYANLTAKYAEQEGE